MAPNNVRRALAFPAWFQRRVRDTEPFAEFSFDIALQSLELLKAYC